MSCCYAEIGCAHSKGCQKTHDICGYARYFDFLMEFRTKGAVECHLVDCKHHSKDEPYCKHSFCAAQFGEDYEP